MSKNKLKLYFTLDKSGTMYRIKPLQHTHLLKFLTESWTRISTEYEKIEDKDKLKGRVVGLQFVKEEFSKLQREIGTRADVITIWQTTRQPIVSLKVKKSSETVTGDLIIK